MRKYAIVVIVREIAGDDIFGTYQTETAYSGTSTGSGPAFAKAVSRARKDPSSRVVSLHIQGQEDIDINIHD